MGNKGVQKDVIVKNNKIDAVLDKAPNIEDTKEIDVADNWAIPGLLDIRVHYGFMEKNASEEELNEIEITAKSYIRDCQKKAWADFNSLMKSELDAVVEIIQGTNDQDLINPSHWKNL